MDTNDRILFLEDSAPRQVQIEDPKSLSKEELKRRNAEVQKRLVKTVHNKDSIPMPTPEEIDKAYEEDYNTHLKALSHLISSIEQYSTPEGAAKYLRELDAQTEIDNAAYELEKQKFLEREKDNTLINKFIYTDTKTKPEELRVLLYLLGETLISDDSKSLLNAIISTMEQYIKENTNV